MPRRHPDGRQAQPKLSGRLVAAALGLATTGVVPVFLAGALAVQMSSEFGYGPRGIGLTIGSFYAVSTVSSVALGRWADRKGWRTAVQIGGWGCVGLLAAVATLSRSLAWVVALLGLAGMANALVQPAVNLLLARRAPRPRRGLLFGLKQSAIPLATFIGGVSVPVLALTVGWRWVFALCALLAAAVLLALPAATAAPDLPPPRVGQQGVRLPSLAPLVAIALLGQTGASVLGSFLVASAVHVGMPEGDAGLLLAVASLIGIAARVLLGWAADRGLRHDLAPVAVLLLIGGLAFALCSLDSVAAVTVGGVVGFAAGWGWPGLFNLIVVERFEAAPATATSATQVGVYVGSGTGPLLFGLLASFSYQWAWLVSAALLLVAAGISLSFRSPSAALPA